MTDSLSSVTGLQWITIPHDDWPQPLRFAISSKVPNLGSLVDAPLRLRKCRRKRRPGQFPPGIPIMFGLSTQQRYSADYTKGAAPKQGYWRTLDNDKVAALNAADLIIVSRCIGPNPPYVKDGESTKWNSVETPMILMHTFFARRRCWAWLDTHTPGAAFDVSTLLALVPHLPIFKDVQLDSKNQVKIFDQTVGSGKVSFNAIADVGNGTLIAKPSDQVWTFSQCPAVGG